MNVFSAHHLSSKAKPSGIARQLVTFLVLPRKVTKRSRPRFAAASRFPALLDWSGLLINSHDPLRGHVLKHIRRTTPDQPALLGGAQGKESQRRFCVGTCAHVLLVCSWALCAQLRVGVVFDLDFDFSLFHPLCTAE